MKILIASYKGGPGKSTLATNLAVEYQRQGKSVLVLEADPDVATSSTWANDREEAGRQPVLVVRKGGLLSTLIEQMADKHDVILIDAPGKNSKEMRSAALAADMILIPTRPSQPDVDACHDMSAFIEEARERNPTLRACVVITQAATNVFASDAQETTAALEESFDIAETVIHQRKSYQTAISAGASVIESKDSKAKAEIQNLAREIQEEING